MAFSTPSGHYEYFVIPFGLSICPAVFQAHVNDMQSDMINRSVFMYLDVPSWSFSETSRNTSSTYARYFSAYLSSLWNWRSASSTCPILQIWGLLYHHKGLPWTQTSLRPLWTGRPPQCWNWYSDFWDLSNCIVNVFVYLVILQPPVTNLNKGSPTRINWTTVAQHAFEVMKTQFTMAPIQTCARLSWGRLMHPTMGWEQS